MSTRVARGDLYPNRCAITFEAEDLIDTGVKVELGPLTARICEVLGEDAPDINTLFHLYLSPKVVAEMAREHLDMVSREQYEHLADRLAQLEITYASLDDYRRKVEAVEEAKANLEPVAA